MFTDMVGYTSLSQKDEAKAVELLDEHRSLLRPVFQRHGGREVKTLGDGFLVEFASGLEAVKCAYDIQQSLHELNSGRLPDSRIILRIGVHLGDVIKAGEDVYGDAVNIASRIEQLASPGGVCITEQVQLQVRNKFEVPIKRIGRKILKNVDQPVDLYELDLPWNKLDTEGEAPSHQVAVLPFANMSPDPQDEFFADGLTEEMIMELSQISGMGVIARTSVMRYKTQERSVKEICRDLGVGYVLEGSVRKATNRIRVTAQLVDTNERHVWAQRYDRELNDIFAVQSEIAREVAGTLELKLRTGDTTANNRTPNFEAYTLCMKARSLNDRRNREANEQAVALFNQALKHDPHYAKACAGLADCYRTAWNWRFIPGNEAKEKARELARRAIEMDSTLAEPHATLGSILDWDRRWDEAEEEFLKAISLNPSYVQARQAYGTHLLNIGRLEDGLRESMKARELDPLSPAVMWNLAKHYYFAGRFDESITEYNRLIDLEPGLAQSYYSRGWLHSIKGLQKEALADWETYYDLTKDEYGYTLLKATGEALWGSREKAMKMAEYAISILDRTPRKFADLPFWFFAIVEDSDQFFKWLDKAIEKQEVSPGYLRNDPTFQKMREDPRYSIALKQLKVPS